MAKLSKKTVQTIAAAAIGAGVAGGAAMLTDDDKPATPPAVVAPVDVGEGELDATPPTVPAKGTRDYQMKVDRDLDGIPNKQDRCPWDHGTPAKEGCP